jgi:hypothetical protein
VKDRIDNLNQIIQRNFEIGKRETAMQLEPMKHDVSVLKEKEF